ncbi:MAG: hypothetical protein NC131_13655 [Roseburia sp.]|nr:hypothetical protein [Roseburia sp.]
MCGSTKYDTVELINNADFAIPILIDLATAYRNEIHEYLAPSNLPHKEETIRAYIKDIMNFVLPLVKSQREKLETELKGLNSRTTFNALEKQRKLSTALTAFYELEDDYTALVAFRHFETFCLYMDGALNENTTSADLQEDVFKSSLHLFKGFYHFANSMVMKKDVRFIEKQCFAGAGKSVTDCALISWIFGVDINNDVLKVFGNGDNVDSAMGTISTLMCSRQYAKVFPYFEKFGRNQDNIFSVYKCSGGKGTFRINGSTKPVNLRVRSKGDKIDGVRAKFLFLDDITAADDTPMQHAKDIDLYRTRWFKRKYNLNNFFVIASGTTYAVTDLLTYLKGIFGVEQAKPTKFAFTSLSKSNQIVHDGLSVFCVVYGLDKYDKSTFEEKFPTEAFIKEREEDERSFMAMTQQTPLPPKGSPFDYDNLPNTYGKEGIPHLQDRSQEVCTASLDPARIAGKDYHSMPIITEIDGRRYLKDALFKQSAPDKIPIQVVDMIEKHHIVHLDIENNTDTLYGELVRKLLRERGIDYCLITTFFTYEKKELKIGNCETSIKSIYFPRREVYSANSQMGQFMYLLTIYNYEKPPKHDDSADSLANYSLRFIINKQMGAKVTILRGRKYT